MTRQAPALVILAAGLARRYGGCKPLAPVGLEGEAVIDLAAGDAMAAGFGEIVLVLGPHTGPAIEYHVRRTWPSWVPWRSVVQPLPLGTAHAVLCARDAVGDRSFAVVNGDDIYGRPALESLATHLGATEDEHALVGFRLADTIVTGDPVTRGTCEQTPTGALRAIRERRKVSRHDDGTFRSADGLEPEVLPGDCWVSVNCWGFLSSMLGVLESSVRAVHPGVTGNGAVPDPDGVPRDADGKPTEVLLPEVVGDLVAGRLGGTPSTVRVLEGAGRCIGVTHAEDLPIVRGLVAAMIASGDRPAGPWTDGRLVTAD